MLLNLQSFFEPLGSFVNIFFITTCTKQSFLTYLESICKIWYGEDISYRQFANGPTVHLYKYSSYFKFFICIIGSSWKNSFHPFNMHNQTCCVVEYLSWQRCKKEVTLIAFTFTSTSISICLCFFKKRDKATFKIFLTCQYLFKVS